MGFVKVFVGADLTLRNRSQRPVGVRRSLLDCLGSVGDGRRPTFSNIVTSRSPDVAANATFGGEMAGGRAGATIITTVVKDLLGDAAEGVERDVAKDAAKTAAKDAAKDAAKTTGKDAAETAGKDAGKDAGRDAADREAAQAAKDGRPGQPPSNRNVGGDPIDVATGEVVLLQTDVELPGVLPLVLQRIHLSTYRQGRLFGISWASTLDQHLEVEGDGVWFTAADGTISAYPPLLMPDVPLDPLTGPARPLTWKADGGYLVEDPQAGVFLHFPAVGGVHGRRLPLVAVIDRNGNRIDFGHDDAGDLVELRHTGGYRLVVEGDGTGAQRRVRGLRLGSGDTNLPLVSYGYDAAGRLTEVVNSSGEPMVFSYDAAGRMTGWRDRNGFDTTTNTTPPAGPSAATAPAATWKRGWRTASARPCSLTRSATRPPITSTSMAGSPR